MERKYTLYIFFKQRIGKKSERRSSFLRFCFVIWAKTITFAHEYEQK